MHPEFIHIGRQRIACYESSGKESPIFFIHSNSTSASMFSRQFDSRIGGKYRLIAIDLPGHGESSPTDNPEAVYSLPGYADILVEAANQLGAEEAIFAGWSLGGHILLEASSRLSNAKGMVLFGTPPVGNPPNMADAFLPGVGTENIFKGELTDEDVASWVRGQFNDGADIPPSFTKDIKRTDGRAREYLGRSFGKLCYIDELKAVDDLKVPLAIFHGENDGCVNLHYLNKLNVPTLWRGEVQLITGAGHTPQWEEAERFNDLLNDFIEEI